MILVKLTIFTMYAVVTRGTGAVVLVYLIVTRRLMLARGTDAFVYV